MTRVFKSNPIWLVVAVALVAVGLGCSTDSPTAPQQTPAPPPGTEVSATWQITVEVDPGEIAVGATEPVRVSIKVRKVGDNSAPPQGTTIVVSASLGEFQALGSGLTSLALGTSNGRAEVLFFPGTIEGTAVISAQLEASAGQTGVRIREGVVAEFDFVNGGVAGGDENLSVQFVNRSTGDPRRFFWEFGDGGTSREENPIHIYRDPGDYVVRLHVERGTFSDRVTKTLFVREPIFITDVTPNEGEAGTPVTIRGQGFIRPLRVLFGNFTADVTFVASDRTRLGAIVPQIPIDEFDTEPCLAFDDLGAEVEGTKATVTFFDITVETIENAAAGGSDTLTAAFRVFPIGAICEITEAEADAGAGGG